MFSPRVKTGAYVLEGINAYATALYFNYLFFFMRDRFGFGDLGNLGVSAVNGGVYMLGAWLGGRVGQRHGYFFALKIGFVVMSLALGAGSVAGTVAGQFVWMIVWTVGMCWTWPNLEAIVCEHETPRRLQRRIGIYNLIWAGGSALAYFTGGTLYEKAGARAVFLLPLALHLAQLGVVWFLVNRPGATPTEPAEDEAVDHTEQARARVSPAAFLKMAWVANPFAYMAMSTAIPLIPTLAARLQLSPMFAGFFCSVWLFARAASFFVLWRWTAWHYRFGWMAAAFVALIGSFIGILLGQNLWLLVAAQIVFGFAVGLCYYASLFYSMDVGETKGEHGGFHESAIGAGILAGPAVGAASLHFFPGRSHVSAWAVSGLLVLGLGGLLWLRYQPGARRDSRSN